MKAHREEQPSRDGRERNAHFHRIEWEDLQNPWEVEDLAESPMLPRGSERIELRRDEQYRIEAKILGTTDGSSANLLPELGETGDRSGLPDRGV